jgi:hypothetical protein
MVERGGAAKVPGAAGTQAGGAGGDIFQTEASWSISSGEML